MPSLLQNLRMEYVPTLPDLLKEINTLSISPSNNLLEKHSPLEKIFPKSYQQPRLSIVKDKIRKNSPLRVGFVFSGGQAAGGHNVVTGLFDALKKMHEGSRLWGFMDGPKGIVENNTKEITQEVLAPYRNQGGFDLVGSGRTKIETNEQFEAAAMTVKELELDGLVIVGGDDSNTNAALLTEFFLSVGIKTRVVGVPKTIDGDLKNEHIEISFGFDSATKTFSEIIGNILTDALSAKKYTFFVKLMGRTASHIALECAMQTHANLTLIGEEVQAQKKTLREITHEITDLVIERSKNGKDYGVILIPEGLIEFIPEFKQLISELNKLLAADQMHALNVDKLNHKNEKIAYVSHLLTEESRRCFSSLPEEIQIQLLLDRDPHGNVQVSKIDTERLLIETVRLELKNREKQDQLHVKFSPQPLFCGYEGRACLPSNFDADYCYALGHVAALLINGGATGYICSISHLELPTREWQIAGIPLVSMIHLEERHGKMKPVIKKALVKIEDRLFKQFAALRDKWRLEDDYINPGPIQFFGPEPLTNIKTWTLMESKKHDLQS